MTLREAMEIKLEVLEVMGIDKEIITTYCPGLPDECGNQLNDSFWDKFIKQIDLMGDMLKFNPQMTIGAVIIHFMGTSALCPYCDFLDCKVSRKIHMCGDCEYGKKNGICLNSDSAWGKFFRNMERIKSDNNGRRKAEMFIANVDVITTSLVNLINKQESKNE